MVAVGLSRRFGGSMYSIPGVDVEVVDSLGIGGGEDERLYCEIRVCEIDSTVLRSNHKELVKMDAERRGAATRPRSKKKNLLV